MQGSRAWAFKQRTACSKLALLYIASQLYQLACGGPTIDIPVQPQCMLDHLLASLTISFSIRLYLYCSTRSFNSPLAGNLSDSPIFHIRQPPRLVLLS
ncbi:hypothetical protein CC85DRAFT_60942 [Cutaneotrichosporon oleaginosum]|uniref:Uncharacterized protein n=1 Tax=Cutaneotrichosporon oleaginosum TaxID=879819 RepID=A0A0J0XQA9_9TREE|nr:uncharacterized protein CC85DRAFT_60942 [Cutaneotrichosporon oleaginosum]KLT43288.1 hypothetical protein CC85DRAFT_60942 [Cutaneotrichosporon oleaginosum]TXT14449.1 hypothetical protein COLE_00642 [Cutaneotrichosporon oleaginosum]